MNLCFIFIKLLNILIEILLFFVVFKIVQPLSSITQFLLQQTLLLITKNSICVNYTETSHNWNRLQLSLSVSQYHWPWHCPFSHSISFNFRRKDYFLVFVAHIFVSFLLTIVIIVNTQLFSIFGKCFYKNIVLYSCLRRFKFCQHNSVRINFSFVSNPNKSTVPFLDD